MPLIRDTYERFKKIFNHYILNSKRNARMKLIIVYKDDIAKPEEIERFVNACHIFEKEINLPSVKFLVMNETLAKKFNDVPSLLK